VLFVYFIGVKTKMNHHVHKVFYSIINPESEGKARRVLVNYCTCGAWQYPYGTYWHNPGAYCPEVDERITSPKETVITDPDEVLRLAYGEAMEYFREFFDVLGASRYPDSKSRQIRFTTGSLFAIEELMKTFGKRFVVEYAFKHRQDIEAAKRLRNTLNVKED
jgi:hypothetical protein